MVPHWGTNREYSIKQGNTVTQKRIKENIFYTPVGKYIEYQLNYDPLTGAWNITKSRTCIDQLADQLKGTQLS